MTEKIILGTVQFGLNYGINNQSGKVSEEEVNQIFDYSFQNGVSILDTADAYGNATDLIGNYNKQSNNQFKIITKFKSGHSDIAALDKVVTDTLERLNISQIFGYLYHSFDDYKKYSDTLVLLEELKEKGYIKYIGVSIYTNEQFEELLEVETIEIIQLPYNLLDNINQRGDLMKRAKAKGKIIHIRSVFLQGLFFKSLDTLPDKLLPLKNDLQQLKTITIKYQMDMASLALNYVMSNPDIDGVLIGVDSLTQLQQNITAIQNPLPIPVKNIIDNIKVEDTYLLNPSNWS